MVTTQFDYLRNLDPPKAVEELSFESIRTEMLGSMLDTLPGWSQNSDDPLYKAIENFAYRELLIRQRVNHLLRQTYLAFSDGSNLRHLASIMGVETEDTDTNEEIRERVQTSVRGLAVGTRASIEADCLAAGVGVDDVEIVVASNGQDITVYPAKEQDALEAADQAILLAYISNPTRIHVGDTATVGVVTTSAYTIVAVVNYVAADTGPVELEERVRESVYAHINFIAKVGDPVYVSGLVSSLDVEGVVNVVVSTPSSDIDKVVGQIPICDNTTTDVALTFTAV